MFGAKFDAIWDVVKILLSVKGEDLAKIMDQIKIIADDGEIKDKVVAGLVIAEVVASYTPIDQDDEVVAALRQLADDELVWKLVDVVQGILAGEDVSEVASAINPDGEIPVGALLQIGIFIAELIGSKGGEK